MSGISIRIKGIFATLATIVLPAAAQANDWEELAKAGYGVVSETSVDGEFQGCEFDKRIPLQNGLIFICRTYSYSYAYSPDVYILRHVTNGDTKVVIDDEEYDGTLVRRR